jgi:RNA methyltransferase, TrmH family
VRLSSRAMGEPSSNRLVADFREAVAQQDRVRLDGFHALKHALRFGAEVEAVMTGDPETLARLARELAPDLEDTLRALTTTVSPDTFRTLGPYAHHTGVVALARRPPVDPAAALGRRDAPVVLLEDPRHLGNLGAVVRVAAAVDAAGVLTVGEQDPWDPVAIRGSGGLHFAVPVARAERLDTRGRPLFALDPEGEDLDPARLPADAVLAFGSEREGLTDELLARADVRLRIPMRPGVSSLNLATSVSAVLFAWRLTGAASARD